MGKEKVKARKRRDSEDRTDPTGLRGPWRVRPPPESFSQQEFLGQGWVASDPRLPGPCVHGIPSRGGGLRDVPLCPLHLHVLHEQLDLPPPSDQQPLPGAGAEPVPWAGYEHPRAQDGQLVCDCLPLSYSGRGVPSPQNPRNSSTVLLLGPGTHCCPCRLAGLP